MPVPGCLRTNRVAKASRSALHNDRLEFASINALPPPGSGW